jgi:hypothetical protein
MPNVLDGLKKVKKPIKIRIIKIGFQVLFWHPQASARIRNSRDELNPVILGKFIMMVKISGTNSVGNLERSEGLTVITRSAWPYH